MKPDFSDEYWMEFALHEAEIAFQDDEIPVGAVIVYKNEIIASSHNSTQKLNNPLAHAEKLVIEAAQKKIGKWLYGCKLFVTLEPCSMCAGIIILARIDAVIFGAFDEKSGTVGSLYNLLLDSRFNHNPEVKSGILAERSSRLLKNFFREKRRI
ncbi:MAG: nucleoside deaminase [Candidatus Cloacimonadota bacterium]|nr:nucleoside deaminase [Candidatus Cloacimonadota bacterium]